MRRILLLCFAFFSVPFGLEERAGGAPLLAQGAPAVSPAYRGEWTADTRNTWLNDDGEPRVQFNLRTGAGNSQWGFGVRLRELAGLPSAAIANLADNVQFTWTREAGTFRFTGSFDRGRGSGTYAFTADQNFVTNMANAGYRNLPTTDIVRMAVIDVSVAHARGLAHAGYANLPLEDLIRTRIHKATPELVRDLASAGIRGLSLEELIRLRIHKVTPDFVKALEARGYRNVPSEDLVKMRIHGVTPEEMEQLQRLGFGRMRVDQLVKFRIHKVTPDYIRSMREVGFTALTEEQLVKMRIHKVDAMFVKHAREDGLTVQTPSEAVDLAIHGPRFRKRR